MANLGKLITGGARSSAAGTGTGFRGKSRRGRPKASPADKAAAKFHGFKTLKAWKEAGSPPIPKRKSSTTPRGSDAPKRTRREKKGTCSFSRSAD